MAFFHALMTILHLRSDASGDEGIAKEEKGIKSCTWISDAAEAGATATAKPIWFRKFRLETRRSRVQ